jgi:hypothetical protein
MTDEPKDSKYHLSYEEACEVIQWAASTAALVVLMKHDELDDIAEKLAGFEEAIDSAFAEIPDCLSDAAYEIAQESVEEAAAEEDAVEQFRIELDNFDGNI